MFEDITKNKRPIPEKLTLYGFERQENFYRYSAGICGGEFELTLQIAPDGAIEMELIETETREPYVLYKTAASGAYVGKIRAAIEQILTDIVDKCFDSSLFKAEQTRRAIEFVRDQYQDELEFLWPKFPANGVWRRKDNRKWYGAILTVAGTKLGLDTDRILEIIDLRMKPDDAQDILSREHYYPGWHMNKKSWYTIVLNDTIKDEELKQRIRESYQLAKKK